VFSPRDRLIQGTVMVRRALLVGSQTYGLTGCEADVRLVEEALERRGFTSIDVRTGSDATRAGIVDGFDRLAAATEPADAVVVYYSGHGGRVARPDGEARRASGSSSYFQFIVPFDIDDSEASDFRGLLSEELTAFQLRLTDGFSERGATPNVTTILDCCHSGYLARDVDLLPKAIDLEPKMFRIMGIRSRAEQVAGDGGLLTNPHAVRLVAAQEEQSAFERASARGGRHGVFTDVLVSVLADPGEQEVSWVVVGDVVRRRVQALVPEQRPAVEGPATRLLFSASTETMPASFPVTRHDGALVIEAAAVFGISVGDTFGLRAPGGSEFAQATVSALRAGNAALAVTPPVAAGSAADGVRATVRTMTAARRCIAVDVAEPTGDVLRRRIDAVPRLSTDTAGPVFGRVVDDGGLAVLDDAGARARVVAEPDDEGGQQRIVELLETLALARSLRELESGAGAATLAATVDIVFAAAGRDGTFTDRPRHGQRLAVGDRVALSLRNISDEQLFLWVFDIGISGRTTLVTNGAPSGTALGPRDTPDDTKHVWGAGGSALSWPPDVPITATAADAARPETLVIILADRRQDLSALVTPGGGERALAQTSLDTVLAEVRAGVRSVPAATSPTVPTLRYRVETIELLVAAGSTATPS